MSTVTFMFELADGHMPAVAGAGGAAGRANPALQPDDEAGGRVERAHRPRSPTARVAGEDR